MGILECSNLTKQYNDNYTALNNISFSINEGDFTGFIGENGAGKTTTMEIISFLLNKSDGFINIFGKELNKANITSIRGKFAYVSDEIDIFNYLTLKEFWTFTGEMYKLDKGIIANRISELSKILDLYEELNKSIGKFSKGMKKKALIGAALIHNPSLILLDEPLEGIDPVSRKIIKDILKQLNESGVTIFISSHDLSTIKDICQNVIIINKGNLKYDGTINDLFIKYKTENLEDIFINIIGKKLNEKESRLSWR